MIKNRSRGLLYTALMLALNVSTMPAQQTPSLRATGIVSDTAGKPLAEAVITLRIARTGSRTMDSAVVRTNASGEYNVTIPITGEWKGGMFGVSVRKLSYTAIDHKSKLPESISNEGLTARISFRLIPAVVTLESVKIKGARGSDLTKRSITAADIDLKRANDALRVLTRYRPGMLGDTDRCPIPPYAQGEKAYAIERLYINGRRSDIPGREPFTTTYFALPRNASASPAVIAALEDIPSEDIDQITLVDCQDSMFPIDRRKALYVSLKPKPLTKKQKKMLAELRLKDTLQTDSTQLGSSLPDSTQNQ